MSKKFSLSLFSLFFVISLSYLFFAFAFTEPTAAPPGNNVPAPINVSATTQTKQGGLNVAINSGTYLGIGTTTPATKLEIVNNNDEILRLTRSGASYPAKFRLGIDSALVLNVGNSDVFTIKNNNVSIWTTLNISSGNLQVSPDIIEISGTNPTCPSGYQTISKYWQSKTCYPFCLQSTCCEYCGLFGSCASSRGCTSCTTGSGWSYYPFQCTYITSQLNFCALAPYIFLCQTKTCQADTWTKVRCLKIGTGNLYVEGNVGIGTTNPSVRLHVYENLFEKSGVLFNIAETNPSYYILNVQSGGTSKLYVRADGNVGIGTTAPNYKLDVSGAIRQINAKNCALYADANGMLICQSSSLKYKTNIKDLDFDINKFLSLTPRSFDWKITTAPFTPAEKGSVGFIAEEVDKKFPDLVRYKDNQPEGVKYEILPVYLFKVVKDLINNFTDKVKSSLNDLGIKIENNIVRFTQIFSQKITTEEIDTQNINTQELCVQNENGEKLCLNKEELKELINLIKKQKEK